MYNGIQGGVWNPQGGARGNIQASSASGLKAQGAPVNSAQFLQPTVSPGYNQHLVGAGGRATAGGGGVTGGGGGASAVDVAAAQKAQQIAGLKNSIIDRRRQANRIFDALTGAVNALAKEKRGQLESQYQQETGRALEDYTKQGDTLNAVYAGRGLADSSYRTNAAEDAATQYQRSIQDFGSARDKGLSQIGADTAGIIAQIGSDRGSVNSQYSHMGDLGDDVASLQDLRNKIDDRIRAAQVQLAQAGTSAGFKGQLNKIAPYSGIGDQLKSALGNLVQAATPQVVKDKIASALISNVAPDEQKKYENYYNQLNQQNQSPTSTEG